MKRNYLVIIGGILLIAGVMGFVISYSDAHQPSVTPTPDGLVDGGGFLPMSLALAHQIGAPTLQPTPTDPVDAAGLTATVEPGAVEVPEIPTSTGTPAAPLIPDRIAIPAIELDAPIIPAREEKIKIVSEDFLQFLAPDQFAVGWHPNSAPLGEIGNTVLNGHHNVHGKVFGRLVDLVPGDRIVVFSGETSMVFQVANILILPERDADLATRLENARWIEPSKDVRLTLVTCWPEYSNTHRLIIVASPASDRSDVPPDM